MTCNFISIYDDKYRLLHWNIILLSHRSHNTFFSLSLILLPHTNFLRLSRLYSYLAYFLYTPYKTVFLVRIEYSFFGFFVLTERDMGSIDLPGIVWGIQVRVVVSAATLQTYVLQLI